MVEEPLKKCPSDLDGVDEWDWGLPWPKALDGHWPRSALGSLLKIKCLAFKKFGRCGAQKVTTALDHDQGI
jgi:hypothetical protein